MTITATAEHTAIATLPDEPGAEINKDQWNGTSAHAVVLNGIADVAQGGTGATSFTLGAVLLGNGTGAIQTDTGLTFDTTTNALTVGTAASDGVSVFKGGISCPAGPLRSERFGAGASINASSPGDNTVVGANAAITPAFSGSCTAIGAGATITANNCTVVGANSSAGAGEATTIGAALVNNAQGAVLVGLECSSSGSAIFALGQSCGATHARSGSFGWGVGSQRAGELAWGHRDQVNTTAGFRLTGCASVQYSVADVFRIGTTWIDSTYATRKARNSFYVYDTLEREFMRADSNGTASPDLFFFGAVDTTGFYSVDGVQVVSNRDTGWTPMTGTSNEATTYDTSSLTLSQLASRVMAIQAALTAHGLLGA